MSRMAGAMKKPNPPLFLIPCLLLAGCQSWTDPAERGSLMIYDNPIVPAIYYGEWASPRTSCGATGDYGMHLNLAEHTVDLQPVTGVEGYSDFEAVVLTVQGNDGAQRRIFLDISEDHRKIRVSTTDGGGEYVLHRCPPPAR